MYLKGKISDVGVFKAYGGPIFGRRRLCVSLVSSAVLHALIGAFFLRGFEPYLPLTAGGGGQTVAVDFRNSEQEEVLSPSSVDFSNQVPSTPEPSTFGPDLDVSSGIHDAESLQRGAKRNAGKVSNLTGVSGVPIVEKKPPVVPKYYYPAEMLDRRPSPLYPISPVYPSEAIEISGKVALILFISEKGKVDEFRVISSDPEGVFDRECASAFSKARYVAGRLGGVTVPSQFVVDITFEPGIEPKVDVKSEAAR